MTNDQTINLISDHLLMCIIMNINQILAICAMLSPIVYTTMWILGGILQSDYSHIRDDISSLFAIDAPNRRLFQAFTFTSSLLLLIFYLGLHEGLNDGSTDFLGPFLFILSGVVGILVALFFPLEIGITKWIASKREVKFCP